MADSELDRIIQAMHQGVLVHAADGTITHVNQATADALGLTIDQVCGRASRDPRWHVIHEDGSPFPGETHPSMVTLASGEPQHDVIMGVHKPDAELAWLSVSSEALFQDDGATIDGVVVTFVDITDQVEARLALDDTQRDYRALFDNLVDIYYRVDIDGLFTLLSPSVYELAGYRPQELLGTSVADLYVDPDRRDEFLQALAADGGSVKGYETELYRKDGSSFWVATSARYREDSEGNPCCIEGTVRDINEKKLLEKELHQSEQLHRTIFESAQVGIVYCDLDGSFIKVNPYYCDITGYSAEELTTLSPLDITHPDDQEATRTLFQKRKAGDAIPVRIEKRYICKNGATRWVEVTANVQTDSEGQIIAWLATVLDIDVRKRAEVALFENQARLSNAEVMAKLGSWEWDIRNDVLRWSEQAYRNFGYQPGEVEPSIELLLARVHPEDRQRVEEEINETLKSGDRLSYEYRALHPDGVVQYLFCQGELLRDSEGQPTRMFGTSQDVTERVEVEQALRASEEHFRSIVELSPVPMAINNSAGKIELLNRKFIELYGWTLDDAPTLDEWWPLAYPDPDYRDKVRTSWLQAVEEAYSSDSEMAPQQWQVSCKGGSQREVEFRMVPIGADRHVISMNDLTDRMRAEEALRDSEVLFRAFFQHAPFGAVLLDRNGIMLQCNLAMQQMLGFSEEEFLSRHFRDITVEQDIEPNMVLFNELVEGKRDSYQMEKRYRRKDGTIFWGNLAVSVIRDEQGTVKTVFAMVENITDRLEGQREQSKLQRQLQQAQKMEAIGQLTGGIAHDFNNILASILGYSQLALEHLLPPGHEKLANALKEINRGGKRAEHLVAQMLDFSRGRPLSPEPTNVAVVVDEVVEMARSTIPSSIRLEQHIEQNIPSVMANPVQLHQVLLNLMINAHHAMEGKGTLTIDVSCGNRQSSCNSCHEPFDGDFLEIGIRDTAGSLTGEVLERAFDPFFTTKPVGRGTGMGLSMVHGILHDWGGHISVSIAPGEATTFHLYIPVTEEPEAARETNHPAQSERDVAVPTALQHRAPSILVVDDEEAIGRFIEELLKIHGYEVAMFNDSREAARAFRKEADRYDLLLTDQTMPHMTGVELIESVHAIRPELPVILSSGYSEQVNEGNATEFGISIYLAKPIESAKLFAAIDSLLSPESDHDKE